MSVSPVLEGNSNASALKDIFTMNDRDDLLMSVTQSASFENFNASELTITLSASNDSMTFDLKGSDSFERNIDDEMRRHELSVKDHRGNGRPPIPNNFSSSYQMTFGRAPYHPHFPKPYYGPHFNTHQPSHTTYNPYQYPTQQPVYPHPGKNSSQDHTNSSTGTENSLSQNSSSSSTSNGGKKRTFEDSMDNFQYGIHRESLVDVTQSIDEATDAVNNLVKDSPVQKAAPDSRPLSRMNSTESSASSLTFGGCSLSEKENKPSAALKNKSKPTQLHLLPSPFNGDNRNLKTPNGDIIERFTFENPENGTKSEAVNTLTALYQINDVLKGESVKKGSPGLELTIEGIRESISWNVEGDELGDTPLSFGSELSGNFFSDVLKSPKGNFTGLGSPSSLGDVNLDDHSSMNYQDPIKHVSQTPGKQFLQTPSTPMNFTSPYPHTMYMFSPGPGMYQHLLSGDRVVNLRGKVPLQGSHPHMHLPPHVPPHHNFLTSPIGLPNRGQYMMPSPVPNRHPVAPQSPAAFGVSKERCVAMEQPLPTKYQGDMEADKDEVAPEFTSLVNFPGHVSLKQPVSLPEGMRCCVMCGKACRCTSAKVKKSENKIEQSCSASDIPIIPTQNKGLCTACDINVWIVQSSGLQIKWCKGCKNFRPWAAFGEKGLATKCVRCRDRQREKYASQKDRTSKK